jgi:ferrous iron transport protein A
VKKLSKFNLNEKGFVLCIRCDGKIKRRIIDMGITPGIKIQVTAVAPLGDPIIAKIRGYKLGIRRSQAEQIITTEQIINKAENKDE